MDSEFQIRTFERDAMHVLEVSGEIDLERGPDFRNALVGLADRPGALALVDMTGVTFIDSTGLSALIVAEKHFRRLAGKIRIVAAHDAVLGVFAATGLDQVFEVRATLDAAAAGGTVLSA